MVPVVLVMLVLAVRVLVVLVKVVHSHNTHTHTQPTLVDDMDDLLMMTCCDHMMVMSAW